MRKKILLSFDLEEFDMPLEYGSDIPFAEQVRVSQAGTLQVLEMLNEASARATFFTTVQFAKESKEIMTRVQASGHEIGSHSVYHSTFSNEDFAISKLELENLGFLVKGFRMPRMMPVDAQQLMKAGYRYDSSLNPIYLPRRYNNFFRKRSLHKTGDLWELPASATPLLRIPLFWLSFHHFPLWFYKLACRAAMYPHGYVVIYFHPWEFMSLEKKYGLPDFTTRNTGPAMIQRFSNFLAWAKKQGYEFCTMNELVNEFETTTQLSDKM